MQTIYPVWANSILKSMWAHEAWVQRGMPTGKLGGVPWNIIGARNFSTRIRNKLAGKGNLRVIGFSNHGADRETGKDVEFENLIWVNYPRAIYTGIENVVASFTISINIETRFNSGFFFSSYREGSWQEYPSQVVFRTEGRQLSSSWFRLSWLSVCVISMPSARRI